MKDIRKVIVDQSCVLLTIVRKSCTTNEEEGLDTDADKIIWNLGCRIVLQRKGCFLYERVHWENHFRSYYYNERTIVIFPYYKRCIELDTLNVVLWRWQQALFKFWAAWNPETKLLKIVPNDNSTPDSLLHPFFALLAWDAIEIFNFEGFELFLDVYGNLYISVLETFSFRPNLNNGWR